MIGTLVTKLRHSKPITISNAALGFATGFIIFLAIKGGKSVLLLQTQIQSIPVNPYSSGLLALLAGLFTERTYAFLESTVEKIQEHFLNVVSKQTGK